MNAGITTSAKCFLIVLLGLLTAMVPVREAAAANVYTLDVPSQVNGEPGKTVQFAARVLLTQSDGNVQGYAVGLTVSPAACSIVDVTLGTAASDADFFGPAILAPGNSATIGVVMGLHAPHVGQTIPAVSPGAPPQELLKVTVKAPVPSDGSCLTCTLQFADGLGNPPKDNIVTIGGHSYTVSKNGGSVSVCGNTPPKVDAGPDSVVECTSLPRWVQLQGSAEDPDNWPNPLTIEWGLLDGPASVAFDDPANPQTRVRFGALGTYHLSLTASDGMATIADQVEITIAEAGAGMTGLVALWTLDETAGAIAHDTAGTNDGVLKGNPAWLPDGGRVGGALVFDGAGDYVDCGKHPAFDLTGQITVAAWIKVGAFDKAWQAIVTKGDSSWRIQRDSTRNGIEFACTGLSVSGTSWGNIVGDINVNDGQWHHVAGVYDGAAMYLYVDGVLDTSAPASGMIATNAFPVCIGEDGEWGGQAWTGLLDEIRLYNVALSQAQITALVTVENSAPIARWRLDETEGAIAHDSAGSHHGTLSGGPVWQPGGGMAQGALGFDGINDFVLTDFVLNPADGPFSIFAWVRGGAPGEIILSQDGSQNGADWLVAGSSDGRLMTDLKGPSRLDAGLSSFMVVTDGNWYEVALVWDGEHRTLYVNGITVAQNSQAGLVGSAGGLNIGAGKNLAPGTFWSGLIDDVRIYNRAVTPSYMELAFPGERQGQQTQ